MALELESPVFRYFLKDKPEWIKLGKYVNWLLKEYVPGAPGISGTFALKMCPGRDGCFLSADFWASPLGQGYCTSITGYKELDVWQRSVKYADDLRKQAIEHQAKAAKKTKRKK